MLIYNGDFAISLNSKFSDLGVIFHMASSFFSLSQAHGIGLEDKKGPLGNLVLDVPEATPVPYPIYQVP